MPYKNEQGMTLMEIVIAMGIFIFASIMIWNYIKNSYQIQNFSFEQSTAITEARRGIETLVKEIRETLPGDTGAYPVESADEQEIIFYADFDRDDAIEKVHYWLDGSEFKKGTTEASDNPLSYDPLDEKTEVISRFVRNSSTPVFTYYDGDYTELSTPAESDEIRLIHIYLKINVFENRAPLDFDLESDVSLRNLKDNL